MTDTFQTVTVDLGARTYPIHVGPAARNMLPDCLANAGDISDVVIIADQTVANLHLERVQAVLEQPARVLTFPPGEASKSLTRAETLFNELADARADRKACIVALGGGVAGDLAGFVAASWLRGIRFIQMPTTILAAVDASVGGKTGVNLATGKNLVGAFHQPIAVLVDLELIATLPEETFRAGLAESVKHAAIRDPDLLTWHEQHLSAILKHDPTALTELLARNCAIKAAVVAADEREAGLRAILNYGHTLGHAFEHLYNYQLAHGECVGLGMIGENTIAVARGELDLAVAHRIRDLLAALRLPVALPEPLEPAAVWSTCQLDKKNRAGKVNFVWIRALGEPARVDNVTAAEVADAVATLQAG
jgi:3-dehydroquinate synthase